MKSLVSLLLLLSFALLSNEAYSQQKLILKSGILSQEDTSYVFVPKSKVPPGGYPVVYLLHGYDQNYKHWSTVLDLQRLSNEYNFLIICPSGLNNWYLNSKTKDGYQMDDFLMKELCPKIEMSYKIDKKNIFVSGMSMGGYGALKLLFTHPDYFNAAGSTSGRIDLDDKESKKISQLFFQDSRIADGLDKLIGREADNSREPFSIISLIKKNKSKHFFFDCGTEDVFYPYALTLKKQCDELKIPATFMTQPGSHNSDYWKVSIQYHFLYFKQSLVAH